MIGAPAPWASSIVAWHRPARRTKIPISASRFRDELEVDELHAAGGCSCPFRIVVEFEIACPPASRLAEIAGIEFKFRQIEDGVRVVAVELDRPLRCLRAASFRPRSPISPARLNHASTNVGSSLIARAYSCAASSCRPPALRQFARLNAATESWGRWQGNVDRRRRPRRTDRPPRQPRPERRGLRARRRRALPDR